jgi:hypothetical protein
MKVEPRRANTAESEVRVMIRAKALYMGLRWATTTIEDPRARAPNA